MMSSSSDLALHPATVRVRKRSLDRHVEFAREAGVCETLEGSVNYVIGDAIVTGEQGERWPVERTIFSASYEPIHPLAVGQNGLYRRRALDVLARQLDHETTVSVGHGDEMLVGHAGDWLIQHGDGSFGVVKPDIFIASYEADG